VAIPAGFEPATHGVEIRNRSNYFKGLVAPCTIGVPFGASRKPPTSSNAYSNAKRSRGNVCALCAGPRRCKEFELFVAERFCARPEGWIDLAIRANAERWLVAFGELNCQRLKTIGFWP
jgi:hypothetical protein